MPWDYWLSQNINEREQKGEFTYSYSEVTRQLNPFPRFQAVDRELFKVTQASPILRLRHMFLWQL